MQDEPLEITDDDLDPGAGARALDPDPTELLARQGRWQVLGIVLVAPLITLYVLVEQIRAGLIDRLPRTAVRLFLTVALMYAIWRGLRWAKWTFAGLAVPVGTAVLLVAIVAGHGAALLAFGSFYLGAGLTLIASRSANAFLAYQRGDDLSARQPARFVIMKGYIVVLLGFLSFLFTCVWGVALKLEGPPANASLAAAFALLGLGLWIGTAVVACEKGYHVLVGIVLGAFAPLGLLILTLLPDRS